MHTQTARTYDAWQRHSCGMHHSHSTRHATNPPRTTHPATRMLASLARMQDSPAPTPAKRTVPAAATAVVTTTAAAAVYIASHLSLSLPMPSPRHVGLIFFF